MDFTGASDAFLVEKVRENFLFLTTDERPAAKGKSKNDDSVTPEDWFRELSWMNMMIFMHAAPEAMRRGLLNAVEVGHCNVVLEMIKEA